MPELDLIVGTHSRLLRIVTDGKDCEWSEIDAAARYYGMTYMPDGNICVAMNHLCVPIKRFDENPYHTTTSQLRILDWPKLEWHDMRPLPLSPFLGDVHQILYAHGGLYICDCSRNALMFWRDDDNLYPSVGEHDLAHRELLFDGTTVDSSHPNSICVIDDEHVAVLLHNRHDRPSEVALVNNTADGPLATVARTPLAHQGAHNLYVRDNVALYNASEDGAVVTYDLDKQRVITEVGVGGHVKGMAITNNHLVVGTSQHAIFADRFGAAADILVFAQDNPTVYARMPLGNVGNINEILER
jgi:hypothetical protein